MMASCNATVLKIRHFKFYVGWVIGKIFRGTVTSGAPNAKFACSIGADVLVHLPDPSLQTTVLPQPSRGRMLLLTLLVLTQEPRGEMYMMSYHCTALKVPKLAVMRNLTAGCFSRALVECVMKARRIPDIVRTDRGPEMVNRVNAEFAAICGIKHIRALLLHQGTKA